jgi:hypothetical protein
MIAHHSLECHRQVDKQEEFFLFLGFGPNELKALSIAQSNLKEQRFLLLGCNH